MFSWTTQSGKLRFPAARCWKDALSVLDQLHQFFGEVRQALVDHFSVAPGVWWICLRLIPAQWRMQAQDSDEQRSLCVGACWGTTRALGVGRRPECKFSHAGVVSLWGEDLRRCWSIAYMFWLKDSERVVVFCFNWANVSFDFGLPGPPLHHVYSHIVFDRSSFSSCALLHEVHWQDFSFGFLRFWKMTKIHSVAQQRIKSLGSCHYSFGVVWGSGPKPSTRFP